MVVKGQCRNFEGRVAPWSEEFTTPRYNGKGQLLGHVAVTHIKPLLPAGTRDRDARMLAAMADTGGSCPRVVALCRDAPFGTRRAGAWQMV